MNAMVAAGSALLASVFRDWVRIVNSGEQQLLLRMLSRLFLGMSPLLAIGRSGPIPICQTSGRFYETNPILVSSGVNERADRGCCRLMLQGTMPPTDVANLTTRLATATLVQKFVGR